MVVHLWRRRQPDRTALRQIHELVAGYRRIEGRAALFPVGQKFIQATRFKNSTRQNMRADFAALFDQADLKVAASFMCQLLEPDCRGQAGWPTANDHDIKFH